IALNRGDAPKAVELLQTAERYELSLQGDDFVGFAGSLFPIYVRGEAYLRNREGARAAAEFQKIIDHRTIVVASPIGPMARLGLARARALAGDRAGAEAAYRDFVALWKGADPDVPVLKQARAESAALSIIRPGRS